jgi:hypothetical protein
MGRGLSDLQKAIIVMAYKNKEAGDVAYRTGPNEYNTRPVVSAHVKREQILQEYFGWRPGVRERCKGRAGVFNREDIGHDRYNTVMVSLSRSLHRLEARGLVHFTHSLRAGGWSGAELTQEGEAAAIAEVLGEGVAD